jgi:ATP-dependent helicase/DNAse subunit B
MKERVTLVDGKKIKRIVEVFEDERHVEVLKSRATLIMLKNRLEEIMRDKDTILQKNSG